MVRNKKIDGTIMVVDDEPSIRKICTLYLKNKGLRVETLEQADDIVNSVTAQKPDVIVLDLNMPGMDGFAAAQQLKSCNSTADIPILVLSGRQELTDKWSAMVDCGADDYITKPFDPEELLTRLVVLLRRKRENDRQSEIITVLESHIAELKGVASA